MRALLSVYDTAGLDAFARGLIALGYGLMAGGATAQALDAVGLPYEKIAAPSTRLCQSIQASATPRGSTAAPGNDAGLDAGSAVAVVACNWAPVGAQPSLETLDVDGTELARLAATQYRYVGIVVDPADYAAVLDELRDTGALSATTRRRLARTAMSRVAADDAAVVTALDEHPLDEQKEAILPPTLHLALERAQSLRYGENPHQQGARYRDMGRRSWWDDVVQHSGVELSYLNLFDAEAAWQLVHDLGDRPAAAIIKHANPCGVAVADEIATAYERAFACDPTSAFGGVVALNRPVSATLAAEMVANPKADVTIAPGYDAAAAALFATKRKNMRVLEAPPPGRDRYELRRVHAGFLVQEIDRIDVDRHAWQVVTRAAPDVEQWQNLDLAWRVCAYVKSNAIVVVRDGQAVGIGAGQQSRVDAVAIAARKAGDRARGGACASDAFFPFRDGLDAAVAAGVATVIQPGGSVRDAEVIAAADEYGIAMVFTGTRHFRH